MSRHIPAPAFPGSRESAGPHPMTHRRRSHISPIHLRHHFTVPFASPRLVNNGFALFRYQAPHRFRINRSRLQRHRSLQAGRVVGPTAHTHRFKISAPITRSGRQSRNFHPQTFHGQPPHDRDSSLSHSRCQCPALAFNSPFRLHRRHHFPQSTERLILFRPIVHLTSPTQPSGKHPFQQRCCGHCVVRVLRHPQISCVQHRRRIVLGIQVTIPFAKFSRTCRRHINHDTRTQSTGGVSQTSYPAATAICRSNPDFLQFGTHIGLRSVTDCLGRPLQFLPIPQPPSRHAQCIIPTPTTYEKASTASAHGPTPAKQPQKPNNGDMPHQILRLKFLPTSPFRHSNFIIQI